MNQGPRENHLLDTINQLNLEQTLVMSGLFLVGFVYAAFFKNYRAALLFGLLIWLSWGLSGDLILTSFGIADSRVLSEYARLLLPLNILLFSLLPNSHAKSVPTLFFILVLVAEMVLLYLLPQQAIETLAQQYVNLIHLLPDEIELVVPSDSVLVLGIAAFIFYIRWHQTDQAMELMLSLMTCLFIAGYYEQSIYYLCIIAGAGLIMVAQLYQSHRMAFVDALTGLHNRRGLDGELKTLTKQYAIAMLDVDHFKKINDRYGHDFGDQVLKMIASRIKRLRLCKFYRYGGEEFCLVFRGRQFNNAEDACEQIRLEICDMPMVIRSRFRTSSRPKKNQQPKEKVASVKVTVSIGLVLAFAAAHADDVIKLADKALYKAKKSGRNRVVARKS